MPPDPPSSSMLRILGSVLRTPLPKRLVPELAPPFINPRSAPDLMWEFVEIQVRKVDPELADLIRTLL